MVMHIRSRSPYVLWWMSLAVAVGAIGCGSPVVSDGDHRGVEADSRISESRLRTLRRALKSDNGWVVRRAVEELGAFVNSDPVACRTLLEHLPDARSPCLFALGKAKGDAAKQVIDAYRECGPEQRKDLQLILGRMGPEVLQAAATLRNELANPQTKPEEQLRLLVVLARMGHATKEDMAAIAKAIPSGDERARDVMAMIGAVDRGDWLDEKITGALIKSLQSSDEENRFGASWALGALGTRADAAVRNALAETFDAEMKEPSRDTPIYLQCGLSLAKVDRSRRTKTLRALMKTHEEFPGDVSQSVLHWTLASLEDEALRREVISLLDDADPDVAIGATRMVEAMGRRGRTAQAKLLHLVEFADNEDLQEAAAEAMALVGDQSSIKELRRLRRKPELADLLGSVIDDSIQTIQLGTDKQSGS